MALRIKSVRVLVNLLALMGLIFRPTSAQALVLPTSLPDLASFSKSVSNGQTGVLRGVYVQDVLAYPIVQQPSYNASFVSNTDGVVTEFTPATQTGNVGLLAHNTLAGKAFANLKLGQQATVIYGDGKTETFVVTKILRFAALSPYSVKSEFKNLDTNLTISATQLFSDVYNGPRHLTFQTCIAYNGNDSWGRLFIIAQPTK